MPDTPPRHSSFVAQVMAERGGQVRDPNMSVEPGVGGVTKGALRLAGKSLRGGRSDPQGIGFADMFRIAGQTKSVSEAVETYIKRPATPKAPKR